MNRRELIKNIAFTSMGLSALEAPAEPAAAVQSAESAERPAVPRSGNRLVEIADACKPVLHRELHVLVSEVRPVQNPAAYLRWEMKTVGMAAGLEKKLLRTGDTIYLDFGRHITGYLHFDVEALGLNIDSPCRVRITYGEVPSDVAENFYPYKGELSAAWLPDEMENLDPFPLAYAAQRRHAFRYVKIEILAMSHKFSVRFSNCRVEGVSSAIGVPAPLPAGTAAELVTIDRVALNTLKDCMQTVFEDGPRRDQRLWIGDFRLQALASYVSYQNLALVKRCLYLLAAYPQKDGMLSACVFEKPTPHLSGDVILDYAAIYNIALAEYYEQSRDEATVRDLWPVALLQMDLIGKYFNESGVFVDPGNIWIFIDWEKTLHCDAALQGVVLCALRSTIVLASVVGDETAAKRLTALREKLLAGAREAFYDRERKLFVSGPERQVSWASQAWLTLAGVLQRDEVVEVLRRALSEQRMVAPGTPYLNHYVVEALMSAGLEAEAEKLIASYWGGMVARGADTFWEVYSPDDSLASPYGDPHINSYCHAWSCTATYFLRAKLRSAS